MKKKLQLKPDHSYLDVELLNAYIEGDEDAFSLIYEKYHKYLYVLAYKYLKDSDASQDAVQFVFVKFWESRPFIQIHVNLKNYLYTMLKNHVLNEIRNNNNAIEKNYELVQFSTMEEVDLLRKIEEKDLMDFLYKSIDKLPKQKKEVCLYKLRGNLSNQDIADLMGISVPTVKTHYAQAIRMLRVYFEKFFILLFCVSYYS